MPYDVERIRSHFPALREGAAHFDGPGGSQTPDVVARAVAETMTSAISNRGTVTRSERRAEQVVLDARGAMADFLGVDPAGVVFGRSATELTFHFARTLALAQAWGPGDEVVVSRLDHDCNVRPWVIAAQARGATVRWADFDPASGELDLEGLSEAVGDRTRLVAVTGASNLIGTRPDLGRLARSAHAAGALLWVDGVHASAHVLTDVAASGADFWVCSPYKFLGPHLGVVGARPDLLETLRPDKLLPSSDAVPERFELGTLPYELLAGVTAAVDFLTGLDDAATGSRRERLAQSYAALDVHESRLLSILEPELRALPGVTVFSNAERRTPTLLFTLEGHDVQDVRAALAERQVNAPAGHFYAWECSHRLGLEAAGGVRVGLAPYTNEDDVHRLLTGLHEIAGRRRVAG
jgi:cysteine desulfurase family protein (TIGR01976 family)